jgi:glutaredoxin
MLTLYTKDNCVYCHMLEEKLIEWNVEYVKKNNEPLPHNHKTYPQLYYYSFDIQRGHSTDLTKAQLVERVSEVEWTGVDGGIDFDL